MIPHTLRTSPHSDSLGPQNLQAIFVRLFYKSTNKYIILSTTACQLVSKTRKNMDTHMIIYVYGIEYETNKLLTL